MFNAAPTVVKTQSQKTSSHPQEPRRSLLFWNMVAVSLTQQVAELDRLLLDLARAGDFSGHLWTGNAERGPDQGIEGASSPKGLETEEKGKL